jgi:succinate dehydrogenase / fumarate reductase membrane anchor subunit
MAVVTNVTSFAERDYRTSSSTPPVIALYALYLIAFPSTGRRHADLVTFFGSLPMKIFSTLTVLAMAAHAWIGMWTVGTDYIREHYFGAHAIVYRIAYQFGCLFVLFVYVLWGLQIFWRF